MIICKMIGHKYTPNLEKIETTSHGIGDEVKRVEIRIYDGSICPRCGDTVNAVEGGREL